MDDEDTFLQDVERLRSAWARLNDLMWRDRMRRWLKAMVEKLSRAKR